MQQITQLVDGLLKRFVDDPALSPRIRATADEVYNLYHTSARTDILNIFLPIIHRLRYRLRKGEAGYFASDEFLPIVGKAVEQRCREVVAAGKMPESDIKRVGPKMNPLLEAIQSKARAYLTGDVVEFESMLESLLELLDMMETEDTGLER